jgi:hypothetical protein
MVKTQQLMRFERYTIPALDDTIRGFFAIFCHLRSRVNQIFLTLVAKRHESATNETPEPALRPGHIGEDRKEPEGTTHKPGARVDRDSTG